MVRSQLIRSQIKRLLHPLWGVVRGVPLLCTSSPDKRKARVYYGFKRIPAADEVAHGGIIKFQRLQEVLPNSPTRFNVLYLVSSFLPLGAGGIAWCSRRKGAVLVWNQNGVAYPAWHGRGWKGTNAPMAKLLREAEHVFYQSEFCKKSADQFLGEPRGTREILYNAVDTAAFSPGTDDGSREPIRLLLGGTQYEYYRVACALEVLACLLRRGVDAQLLVTGRLSWARDEGHAMREARALIARLGLGGRVTFSGPYSQQEAPSVLCRAHILLHTKVSDPCPGLVVEAMACGLPVVYSATGGTPELVGDQAGIGVPGEASWEREIPPDPSALADAVLLVVERRNAFARAARQRAMERFDIKPWVQRHLQIFEELLR